MAACANSPVVLFCTSSSLSPSAFNQVTIITQSNLSIAIDNRHLHLRESLTHFIRYSPRHHPYTLTPPSPAITSHSFFRISSHISPAYDAPPLPYRARGPREQQQIRGGQSQACPFWDVRAEDEAQGLKNCERLLARQDESGLTGARCGGLEDTQPKIVETWRRVVLHIDRGMIQRLVSTVTKVEHEATPPDQSGAGDCYLGSLDPKCPAVLPKPHDGEFFHELFDFDIGSTPTVKIPHYPPRTPLRDPIKLIPVAPKAMRKRYERWQYQTADVFKGCSAKDFTDEEGGRFIPVYIPGGRRLRYPIVTRGRATGQQEGTANRDTVGGGSGARLTVT